MTSVPGAVKYLEAGVRLSRIMRPSKADFYRTGQKGLKVTFETRETKPGKTVKEGTVVITVKNEAAWRRSHPSCTPCV